MRNHFRLLSHDALTEVRCVDPRKNVPTVSHFVGDEDGFVLICDQMEREGVYNIYTGIHSRRERDGTARAVDRVKTFVIDVDPVRPKGWAATPDEMQGAQATAQDIATWLAAQGISSVRCTSGNGVMVYIALPAMPVTPELAQRMLEAGRFFRRRFSNYYAVVDNMGDLARIIKVVGTTSIKGVPDGERQWREATWLDPPLRQESHEFIRWMFDLPLEEDKPIAQCAPSVEAGVWIERLRQDERLRMLWDNPKNDDRSKQDWIITLRLIEMGASDVDIAGVLRSWMHSKANTHKYPDRYLELTIKNGRKYLGR